MLFLLFITYVCCLLVVTFKTKRSCRAFVRQNTTSRFSTAVCPTNTTQYSQTRSKTLENQLKGPSLGWFGSSEDLNRLAHKKNELPVFGTPEHDELTVFYCSLPYKYHPILPNSFPKPRKPAQGTAAPPLGWFGSSEGLDRLAQKKKTGPAETPGGYFQLID